MHHLSNDQILTRFLIFNSAHYSLTNDIQPLIQQPINFNQFKKVSTHVSNSKSSVAVAVPLDVGVVLVAHEVVVVAGLVHGHHAIRSGTT